RSALQKPNADAWDLNSALMRWTRTRGPCQGTLRPTAGSAPRCDFATTRCAARVYGRSQEMAVALTPQARLTPRTDLDNGGPVPGSASPAVRSEEHKSGLQLL